MRNEIIYQIKESISTKQKLLDNTKILDTLGEVAKIIISAYRKNKKVMLAGNGGSAADAQHIAGELVSRFYINRPALNAIALTTDTSILTAIGNDYGYEKLFERQIEALGQDGDIFIGISTSGNSKNIVNGLKIAKEKNIVTIGLTGAKIGVMDDFCDYLIKIPSEDTPRIQEVHIMVGHILCYLIEKELFGR